ncbi:gas vesicle accessory protein GvpU [Bacillus piscicola]|uniref:gas vesicle accessory protein GvpU n=1 Tax=Bacillus piscicola TaxID=1632684 RepID=UPI001F08AB26|nr:gas vesicle accessory protein GvpU [Bacillus piscicola]
MIEENLHHNDYTDFLLRYLIRLADNGAEMDVTLQVNGTTITGQLIGNVTYMQEVRRRLKSEDEELGEKISAFLDKMTDKFAKHTDADEYETGYLHLRQAKMVVGKEQIPLEGDLWRGKAADVNGFSFGSIAVKKEEGDRFV